MYFLILKVNVRTLSSDAIEVINEDTSQVDALANNLQPRMKRQDSSVTTVRPLPSTTTTAPSESISFRDRRKQSREERRNATRQARGKGKQALQLDNVNKNDTASLSRSNRPRLNRPERSRSVRKPNL